MSGRVVPTLRLAVLCAHVELDGDGLVFSLNEPIHTLQLPSGATTQYLPPTMMLYAQLADGVGTFHIRAELRNELGIVQYQSPPVEVVFAGTEYRVVPVEIVIHLDGLVFSGPGLYELHVLCNHQSFSDLRTPIPVPFPPLRVSVLPSEPLGDIP